MYLAPDGDEIEIANAAADFMAGSIPIERLKQHGSADLSAEQRLAFGEMGWFALAVPEADGGSGLSAVEHALLFREVGRQCGPVDVLAQALAAQMAAGDGLHEQVLSGALPVALAVEDGARLRILGAAAAGHALQVTRDGAKLLKLDGEGEVRPSLDPATSMRLMDPGSATTVAEVAGEAIWRMGALGTASMLLGVAEAALDMIVDYAKVRETFGRKIGAYQAVRHPCANMALSAEAARCQLWFAAAALKEDRPDAAMHLDAAKHLANQAAMSNADANIQLHGGIGVTDEHGAHLLLKHGLLLSKLFGAKRTLLSRLLHSKDVA